MKFNDPAYQEWSRWVFNSPILPKHIWESKANEDILKDKNPNGIGTGPYKYKTASQDRFVYEKNPDWWAIKALNVDPKPKYIVDIVNGANNVALGMVMQGGIDLSNNFLPGVATLVDQGYVRTYYPQAPYMLSANTAWLANNDAKAPIDDAQFRLAIANAINTPDIVNKVYGTSSRPRPDGHAADLGQVHRQGAASTSSGSSTTPTRPRTCLADAGYKAGGDGFVTNKDGSPIKLTVMVPTGWSDWEASRDVIIDSLKSVGINAEARVRLQRPHRGDQRATSTWRSSTT